MLHPIDAAMPLAALDIAQPACGFGCRLSDVHVRSLPLPMRIHGSQMIEKSMQLNPQASIPMPSAKAEPWSTAVFGIGCIIFFLISWLLLFPGFSTHDSLAQLADARSGQYSDWHPPVMSWLWRQIERVVPGTSGMLGLQLAMLWSGIFLSVSALTKHLGVRFMLALMLFLFPPVLGWASAIGKDALALGASLIATGLVLRIGADRPLRRLLWGSAAAFFAVCAVRHNGLFLVAGLALLAGMLLYPERGMRSAVLTALLLFLIPLTAAQLVNKALVDTPGYFLAGLLSFDVSGVAVRQNIDSDFNARYQAPASVALLRPGHQLSELRRWHQPQDWLYLAEEMSRDIHGEPPVPMRWEASHMQALKPLWKEIVLKYPADYLAHRSDVFLSLLSWGERSVGDPACLVDRVVMPGALVRERTDFQKVLGWRLDWVVKTNVLLKPWPYFLAAWALLAVALLLRPCNWRLAVGLLVSGLLHECALFFLAPATEYRYSAWMMVTVFLTIFTLSDGLRAAASNRKRLGLPAAPLPT
jgi:hypothetical protein